MATDPICGMTVDPKSAAGKHEHNGHTYYFCSQRCFAKFREEPERFVRTVALAHLPTMEKSGSDNDSVADPVCGMTVDPGSAAVNHEHNGTTYYFCSRHCAQKFAEDPEKWLNVKQAGHAGLDNDRSEERRVGKSVDLGGRRIIKKKKKQREVETKNRTEVKM